MKSATIGIARNASVMPVTSANSAVKAPRGTYLRGGSPKPYPFSAARPALPVTSLMKAWAPLVSAPVTA